MITSDNQLIKLFVIISNSVANYESKGFSYIRKYGYKDDLAWYPRGVQLTLWNGMVHLTWVKGDSLINWLFIT